jgi:hypothetical protein
LKGFVGSPKTIAGQLIAQYDLTRDAIDAVVPIIIMFLLLFLLTIFIIIIIIIWSWWCQSPIPRRPNDRQEGLTKGILLVTLHEPKGMHTLKDGLCGIQHGLLVQGRVVVIDPEEIRQDAGGPHGVVHGPLNEGFRRELGEG